MESELLGISKKNSFSTLIKKSIHGKLKQKKQMPSSTMKSNEPTKKKDTKGGRKKC